jgi:hypothetical protein
MIIYGTKAKKIYAEIINQKCPHCGTHSGTEFYIFQKYAHVFWIPLFPIGKTAVSQCEHCKKVMKLNEMPKDFKDFYEENKKTAAPFWMYSGAALIAVLIISGLYSDYQKTNASEKYIQDLKTNDLLEIKIPGGGYTWYKITETLADTIYLKQSLQESTLESGLEKINTTDNNFTEEEFVSTRKAFKEKFKSGEIMNVIRNP